MNEMIDLRDSKLVAVSWADGVAVVMLGPAFIHRSEGRPGVDAGTVWRQSAMFTLTNALVSAHALLPESVRSGSLRIGAELRENIIPAAGVFSAAVELRLDLNDKDHLNVTGDQIMITLTGEPELVENFPGAK